MVGENERRWGQMRASSVPVEQGRQVEVGGEAVDDLNVSYGRDARVMVEVQKGDLAVRLAQDEDDRVQKLPEP